MIIKMVYLLVFTLLPIFDKNFEIKELLEEILELKNIILKVY
jgi:hypothetical protein